MSANVPLPIQRKRHSRLTPSDVLHTRLAILRYVPVEIVDMILELAAYLPASIKASYIVPIVPPRPQLRSFTTIPNFDIRFESPPLPAIPVSLRLVLHKRIDMARSMSTQVVRLSLAMRRPSGEIVPLRIGFTVPFKRFTKSWTVSLFEGDFTSVTRKGDRIVVLARFS
ncbi:hypothetical protein NEOLEDRAFT_1183872 [Neolentinus lepideus HHB14362 ss-1]|uniref:Uncharacterized protein n=1 Tax=Neolentinus lepideus HHB14362 ss-1 TaxID=1314782 RepID=A0A165MXP7_9AGAM|nr:hypothetical protein NEOLEDRAFT_1183872 [Neolentinus lepideus HHB14362 ss-1]